MLRIEARGAGRYAATPESFWGATARGDLLARMALAAIAEAGAAPTSLHASFLADAEPDEEVAIRCDTAIAAQRRVHLEQRGAPICDAVLGLSDHRSHAARLRALDPPARALGRLLARHHAHRRRRRGPRLLAARDRHARR